MNLYGAIPVPVATMMMSASGVFSGISMTLPEGPVSITSSPGFASHKKLEQTPFFAGSSLPNSGSQYVARRTHKVVVVPYKHECIASKVRGTYKYIADIHYLHVVAISC